MYNEIQFFFKAKVTCKDFSKKCFIIEKYLKDKISGKKKFKKIFY
jgi:hypothetical protein